MGEVINGIIDGHKGENLSEYHRTVYIFHLKGFANDTVKGVVDNASIAGGRRIKGVRFKDSIPSRRSDDYLLELTRNGLARVQLGEIDFDEAEGQ